jgi:hypothetical protein
MPKYTITTQLTVDVSLPDDFTVEGYYDILEALDCYHDEQGDWKHGLKIFDEAVKSNGRYDNVKHKIGN